jgi:DNA-binding NarL/FixJ family response regulator
MAGHQLICLMLGRFQPVAQRFPSVSSTLTTADALAKPCQGGMSDKAVGLGRGQCGSQRRYFGLLGTWPQLEANRCQLGRDSWSIVSCPRNVGGFREVICRINLSWVILAGGISDDQLVQLVAIMQGVAPSVKLAVLGDAEDLRRCELWLARGAAVYLRSTMRPEEVVDAVIFSEQAGLDVIDASFRIMRLARQAQMRQYILAGGASLTKRELDVLALVCVGLRNSAIALSLSITEATVEFHVSNILRKLGAASRMQAAQCAETLGLATGLR